MRIGGLADQVLAKLGAVPQQIAAGDIYPALERDTIDAAEWVGPYDEKLGYNKVAPDYCYPGWWEESSAILLLVNKAKWDALSSEDKALMTAAAHQANTTTIAKYDQLNPGAIRRPAAAGVQPKACPAFERPFRHVVGYHLSCHDPLCCRQIPHGGVGSFSLDVAVEVDLIPEDQISSHLVSFGAACER